jgi:hypothetical protein
MNEQEKFELSYLEVLSYIVQFLNELCVKENFAVLKKILFKVEDTN